MKVTNKLLRKDASVINLRGRKSWEFELKKIKIIKITARP